MTATSPPTSPDGNDQDDATNDGHSAPEPAEGADNAPPGHDGSADRAG